MDKVFIQSNIKSCSLIIDDIQIGVRDLIYNINTYNYFNDDLVHFYLFQGKGFMDQIVEFIKERNYGDLGDFIDYFAKDNGYVLYDNNDDYQDYMYD